MHEFEQITQAVTKDRNYYIKTNNQVGTDISSMQDDLKAYQTLSRWYATPRVRLLNNRENPILVMSAAKGESLFGLTKKDPETAAKSLRSYTKDLVRCWRETVCPLDKISLSRDIHKSTIAMADRLLGSEEIQAFLDKPVIANGIEYPNTKETLEKVKNTLLQKDDPVMVYGHGDEHLGNIVGYEGNYTLIDPRSAGYMTPALAINSLVGNHFLVQSSFDVTHKISNNLDISFEREKQTQTVHDLFVPVYRELVGELSKLSDKPFLLKEYLFCGLTRSCAGLLKYKDRAYGNRFAHLALANEIYYGGLL